MLHPVHNEVFTLGLIDEQRRRLALVDSARQDVDLQALMMMKAQQDPVWWVNCFVWTYSRDRVPHKTPFVLFEHQAELFRAVLGRLDWSRTPDGSLRNILCDKSRDMGITYVILAAILWTWLFSPGSKQGLISMTGPDVYDSTEDSLFGKVLYMLRSLPVWMIGPEAWKFNSSQRPVLTNLRNGADIAGSKQGPNPLSGGRRELVFVDEGSKIRLLGVMMKSLVEVGRIVIVGTSNGMGNHLARLINQKTTAVVLKPEDCAGRNGYVHVRYHYALDPRKSEAWEAKKRAELTDEEWAQEHEIDYTASAPGRIWPKFNEASHVYSRARWHELRDDGWLDGAVYLEGWDFGTGPALTAVVWCAYVASTDTLYCLDYRQFHSTHYNDVAVEVAAAGYQTRANINGRAPHHRIGDIAGKARDSAQRSWFSNLKTEGIKIVGQSMQFGRIEHSIGRIALAIRDGRLYCAPNFGKHHTQELPSGVECLQQYRRSMRVGADTPGTFVGEDAKPLKDVHSHLADALQHVALKVWPMTKNRNRHQGLK